VRESGATCTALTPDNDGTPNQKNVSTPAAVETVHRALVAMVYSLQIVAHPPASAELFKRLSE
jgi:hypothetical protein